ncbi:hypothetical protein IQ22_03194 [Pseudomonas duriflava]|uniref:MFS transporter n=1 Tax=Pseudomonas duriflava TaxID=459528 RepID=A0A562Q7X8_9PSED|nr:hypothetical protein IQ22_03194 [Pseudomonas duriflava]
MIGITLTSLVGAQLTSIKALATLPMALLVVGNLGAVQPLSMFMQRHGRRFGLMLGAAAGIAGGLICAAGVWLADFVVFCLGSLPIGLYMASVMYYRFAAQEAVGPEAKGRATAYVIGGGLLAALIAPSLALWSQNALPIPFLGAYLVIALLAFIALLCLAGLPQGVSAAPRTGGWQSARNLLARPAIRVAMLLTGIGHGVMLLVMNATPLAMQMCGFP